MAVREVDPAILEKQGEELFKELLRIYAIADIDDYCKAGKWRDDLIRTDMQIFMQHRTEAGGLFEITPLDEVEMPAVPVAPSIAGVGTAGGPLVNAAGARVLGAATARPGQSAKAKVLSCKFAGGQGAAANSTLYVSALPLGYNAELVTELFTSDGYSVTNARLLPYNPGLDCLAAMIDFSSTEEATKAIETHNGKHLEPPAGGTAPVAAAAAPAAGGIKRPMTSGGEPAAKRPNIGITSVKPAVKPGVKPGVNPGVKPGVKPLVVGGSASVGIRPVGLVKPAVAKPVISNKPVVMVLGAQKAKPLGLVMRKPA